MQQYTQVHVQRLDSLAQRANKNGHSVRVREEGRAIHFQYGSIQKRIILSNKNAIERIDECCEILESIAFYENEQYLHSINYIINK